MTENELQQLSKDVAEKYGIDEVTYLPFSYTSPKENNEFVVLDYKATWLHQDSARCFNLMVEHDVVIMRIWQFDGVGVGVAGYPVDIREEFADHNNDKHLATRVAILKALLAKD